MNLIEAFKECYRSLKEQEPIIVGHRAEYDFCEMLSLFPDAFVEGDVLSIPIRDKDFVESLYAVLRKKVEFEYRIDKSLEVHQLLLREIEHV